MFALSRSLILIVRPVNPVRRYGAAQLPTAVPLDVSHPPMYLTFGSETEPSPVAAAAGGAAATSSASTAASVAIASAARTTRLGRHRISSRTPTLPMTSQQGLDPGGAGHAAIRSVGNSGVAGC